MDGKGGYCDLHQWRTNCDEITNNPSRYQKQGLDLRGSDLNHYTTVAGHKIMRPLLKKQTKNNLGHLGEVRKANLEPRAALSLREEEETATGPESRADAGFELGLPESRV